MNKNKVITLLSVIVAVVAIAITTLIYIWGANDRTIEQVNELLFVDEIKLLATDESIVKRYGEGKLTTGFGGYSRVYDDLGITLGFSNDNDGRGYNKVCTILISNPDYLMFNLQIGDQVDDIDAQMQQYGFKFDGELYRRGEVYYTASNTDRLITEMRVMFVDRKLQDRVY